MWTGVATDDRLHVIINHQSLLTNDQKDFYSGLIGKFYI